MSSASFPAGVPPAFGAMSFQNIECRQSLLDRFTAVHRKLRQSRSELSTRRDAE
jgi:hypothetical protein